jgi:hypothetical protein
MRVVCGKIGKFRAKFEDFEKIMALFSCHADEGSIFPDPSLRSG